MLDEAALLALWGLDTEVTIPIQLGPAYAPRIEVAILDFKNGTAFAVKVDWLADGPHAAGASVLYQDPITGAWYEQPLPAQVCKQVRFRLDAPEDSTYA